VGKKNSNVVTLPVITTLPLDPNRVLRRALEAGMTEVVIIGYTKDGEEYFASSVGDGGSVVWHLERAKHKLIKMADGE
jgi:hypothetical protein